MQIVPWTDGQLDVVKALAAGGHSARLIAEELNTTRNSIIDICRRKGIKLVWQGTTVKKTARARIHTRVSVTSLRAKITTPTPKPPRERPHLTPDPTHRCTFFELNTERCRWPLWGMEMPKFWEQFYCGAPTKEESSYCCMHNKTGTQVSRGRFKPGSGFILNGHKPPTEIPKI